MRTSLPGPRLRRKLTRCVADHGSRRGCALVLLFGVAYGALASVASAQAAERLVRPRPVQQAEELQWFRGPLAAAYLAPPLALSVDLAAGSQAGFGAVLVTLVGVPAPALVHMVYDDRSGAGYAILGMLLATGAGAVSGAAVASFAPTCAPGRHDQICGKSAERLFAAVFGFVGYLSWVMLDVGFFAHPAAPSSADSARVSAAVVPVLEAPGLATSGVAGATKLRIAGAQLQLRYAL